MGEQSMENEEMYLTDEMLSEVTSGSSLDEMEKFFNEFENGVTLDLEFEKTPDECVSEKVKEIESMQERGFFIYNGGRTYCKVATDKDGAIIPAVNCSSQEECLTKIRELMVKEPEFEFLARIAYNTDYATIEFMERIVTAKDVPQAESKAIAHYQDVFANNKELRGKSFELIVLPGDSIRECTQEIAMSV